MKVYTVVFDLCGNNKNTSVIFLVYTEIVGYLKEVNVVEKPIFNLLRYFGHVIPQLQLPLCP